MLFRDRQSALCTATGCNQEDLKDVYSIKIGGNENLSLVVVFAGCLLLVAGAIHLTGIQLL